MAESNSGDSKVPCSHHLQRNSAILLIGGCGLHCISILESWQLWICTSCASIQVAIHSKVHQHQLFLCMKILWISLGSGICASCANTGSNSFQSALTLLCMRKRILDLTGFRDMPSIAVNSFQLYCMRKRISLKLWTRMQLAYSILYYNNYNSG
jgi:hypothetical protein